MIGEREQLIKDEGLKLKPYLCTAKKITIGIGRNLEDNPLTPDEVMVFLLPRPHIRLRNTEISEIRDLLLEDFRVNGITKDEAFYLFENDVKRFSAQLFRALPWLKWQPVEVQRILLNMTFQMGIAGLLTFVNTLAAVESGDYIAASEKMKLSLWYTQTPERADRLIKRMAAV